MDSIYDKLGMLVRDRLNSSTGEQYFNEATVRVFNSCYEDGFMNITDIMLEDKLTAVEILFTCCLGRLPDIGVVDSCRTNDDHFDLFISKRLKSLLSSEEYSEKHRAVVIGNVYNGARSNDGYWVVNLLPKQLEPILPETTGIKNVQTPEPQWDPYSAPQNLFAAKRGGLFSLYKKLPLKLKNFIRNILGLKVDR